MVVAPQMQYRKTRITNLQISCPKLCFLLDLSRILDRCDNNLDKVPGVNFINILFEVFTSAVPKSAKNTVKPSVFFALLGSVLVKAFQKMLGKSTTDFSWTDELSPGEMQRLCFARLPINDVIFFYISMKF